MKFFLWRALVLPQGLTFKSQSYVMGLSCMNDLIFISVVSLVVTGISTESFSIYHNIEFANIVFAQNANNASTVVVPSESGKMEITLKNAQSIEPDYSIYIQILTAISSATAAIIGGYLASRYAHKQAMDVENLRYQQEKQKQEEVEAKESKLKND